MPIRQNNIRRMGLDAGQRDRFITIQKWQTPDQLDSEGAPKLEEGWVTLVSCMPAAKFDGRADEKLRDGSVQASFDTRWVINYRLDMDPELIDVPKLRRIVVQDRIHEIIHAAEIGRREGVEIFTRAGSKVPS